ncbi:MAG: ABC transporter ATP-binding protein [Erythrobacter sp.]
MNLEFQNIGHHYGSAPALTNVDLLVPSGEVTCLLGSSGCGKTTLLNLAAGLLDVQQGAIALDGDVLADSSRNPPPEKRPIGLVFQDGALFPHMHIADNILFGVDKALRSNALAEQWLSMIGLPELGARFPSSLSGGQAQRVALARAMAPEPAVLLLDEPFASIDVVLRRDLRRECRRLLKARDATAIMVTHDPEEAMDVADKIAVMDGGRIVQAGTPDELYNAPTTLSVGAMFGESQVVAAQVDGGDLQTAFGVWPLSALTEKPQGKQIDLLIRDGVFSVKADPNGLLVKDIRKTGRNTRLTLANDTGEEISISCNPDEVSATSDCLSLHPKPASIIAFAKEG